jgi:hypothetical protein
MGGHQIANRVAHVLGVLLSLSKGWSPVKKLFALLFSAGLLSLAVGCPPATSTSATHSGSPRGAGSGTMGMPPGMPTHPGGGTAGERGTERATEKAGPGHTEKTTEKAGPGGAEKATEKKDTKKTEK